METFIIQFPSVTYAQKGQRVLDQKGIRSRLTRSGGKGASRGCSYGLEISFSDPRAVRRLFEENGVIYTLS